MKIWIYRGIFRRRRRRKIFLALKHLIFWHFFRFWGGVGQQDFGWGGRVRAARSRTESGLGKPCYLPKTNLLSKCLTSSPQKNYFGLTYFFFWPATPPPSPNHICARMIFGSGSAPLVEKWEKFPERVEKLWNSSTLTKIEYF